MFNITIISNNCGTNRKYIHEIKSVGFKVNILSKMDEFERTELSKMSSDVVIIEESGSEDFFNTCELIMKIRRSSNTFIWVMAEKDIRKQKIYILT